MYVENIHEKYGVQSSKLFFQWGGLTHCDPLSMPSGALLQWLVCASLPGVWVETAPSLSSTSLPPGPAPSRPHALSISPDLMPYPFPGRGSPLQLRGLPPQRHLARGFICF